MHSPIQSAGNETQTLTLDPVMDAPTAVHCPQCGETVTPDGRCLNVATCASSHAAASKLSRGETVKARLAPSAWTVSGRVD